MTLLRLYADCFRRTGGAIRRSPWTLALPIVYALILVVAGVLLSPLGMIGTFIANIISDLCISSFLYFLAQSVAGSPSRPSELKDSFLVYFWPVISFYFVIWIASWLLGAALRANPQGEKIELALFGVAAVLLNAVPEVIYQKSEVGGLGIVAASVRFIQTHWIEWFIPNLLLGGVVYGAIAVLLYVPYSLFIVPPVVGALAYFIMTFRGNLFSLLDRHSPHQLKMKYRGKTAA